MSIVKVKNIFKAWIHSADVTKIWNKNTKLESHLCQEKPVTKCWSHNLCSGYHKQMGLKSPYISPKEQMDMSTQIPFSLTHQQFLISYHEIKLTWPFGFDPLVCKSLSCTLCLENFFWHSNKFCKERKVFLQARMYKAHFSILCKPFYIVLSPDGKLK